MPLSIKELIGHLSLIFVAYLFLSSVLPGFQILNKPSPNSKMSTQEALVINQIASPLSKISRPIPIPSGTQILVKVTAAGRMFRTSFYGT